MLMLSYDSCENSYEGTRSQAARHKPELHSPQKYRPHPCWPLRDPSERLNALG